MTEPTSMPPPETAVSEPHRHRSVGERVFDWGVYGGIAGIGTFVATVPFAYLLKYGKLQWFHKGLSEGIEGIAKAIAPGRDHAKLAEKVAMTTTLMQGGNAMLVPIGIAEKHKVAIVEKINAMVGDTTPTQQVEETQKQTWGSLIKARITAWLVVFTSLTAASKMVPRSFELFETEFAERICQFVRKPTHVAGKETKTFIYGKIGALDIFATAAAAVLLYIGGHIFAERAEEKREERREKLMAKLGLPPTLPQGDAPKSLDEAAAVNPQLQVNGEKQRAGTVVATQTQVHVG